MYTTLDFVISQPVEAINLVTYPYYSITGINIRNPSVGLISNKNTNAAKYLRHQVAFHANNPCIAWTNYGRKNHIPVRTMSV